jgi:hypothetical protein
MDDVETLRNRTVTDFQTIRNMRGIWDRLQMAIRHEAEARIQAGGAHMVHLL